MNLDELMPETLTEEHANAAWEWLRAKAKERHARIAEATRGGLSLQGFCVCGYPTMGRGSEHCWRLREIAEGGDETEWLTKARALRDALEGR